MLIALGDYPEYIWGGGGAIVNTLGGYPDHIERYSLEYIVQNNVLWFPPVYSE